MRVGHLASAAPAAFSANLAIVGPSSMTWKRVNKPASFISKQWLESVHPVLSRRLVAPQALVPGIDQQLGLGHGRA